jgi:CRISPR-associated protein Csm5
METIDDKIKVSKEKLGLKIPCTLEILSPVHIGSGVKLAKNIDFNSDGNSITIVSQAELMQYLEDNPDELETFTKGNYKLSSLKKYSGGKKYYFQNKWTNEIFEFESDGNGTPYIPGSSLKGAIRTIIIKKLFDGLSQEKKNNVLSQINNSPSKKEWAADSLLKELLGSDSNHNLMRMIQVFDIYFPSVELSKVVILSLTSTNGTSYGWKKMGPGMPNVALNQNPTSLIVESLPVGEKSNFSIHIDDFLSQNEVAKNTLHFDKVNLGELCILINEYSRLKLNDEKTFFSGLQSPQILSDVIKEIENIIAYIPKKNSPTEKTEFVIRMSWGIGWKGMTGDYLSADWLEKFRRNRNYKMTKHPDFPIYPKTRKIVFDDDTPKYLTGWVKIRLNDFIQKKEILEKSEPNKENLSGSLDLSKLSQLGRIAKKKK